MKRPGAVLEAGSILARLELDDPSQMKRVRLNLKLFFEMLSSNLSFFAEYSMHFLVHINLSTFLGSTVYRSFS